MIKIDSKRHRVYVEGKEVHLPPAEFVILRRLKEVQGIVQGRSILIDTLAEQLGGSREVNIRTIDQHIARIRTRIGYSLIRTVPKFGYQLDDRRVKKN